MLHMLMNKFADTWVLQGMMAVMLLVGIMSQMAAAVYYLKKVKKAEDILHTKDKLLKQIALKYESCYRLNGYVNDTYVMAKKYLYRDKVFGMTINSLNRISDVCKILISIFTMAYTVSLYFTHNLSERTLLLLIGSVCAIMVLTLFDRCADITGKEEKLLCYIQDYLENTLEEKLKVSRVVSRTTLIEDAVREAREAEHTKIRPINKKVVNGNSMQNAGVIADVIEEYLS